ncbi:MAG: DNA-binding protein WhiA [Peptococcaceae bacterium]|nr:DNA-binding protein WhiA [Peptococcaceae bacterium]
MSSFSSRIKEELARLPSQKECCHVAELAALVRHDADVGLEGGVVRVERLTITTESPVLARRIFGVAKPIVSWPTTVAVRRKMRLKKNNAYVLGLTCSGEELIRLGLVEKNGARVPGIAPRLVKKRCDRKAYLRGAFLASGSMSNPENSYHLEITCKEAELAADLAALLNGFALKAGVSARKHMHVVYLKDSDKLSEFLALIGAHEGVLQFENIRVMKDVRNTVNRQVNCDSANLTKTVNAALRQQEKIRLIEGMVGFQALPEHLRAVAQLRLQYPEATLKELGEHVSPPIGKSGVSHRLKSVEEFADRVVREKGGGK